MGLKKLAGPKQIVIANKKATGTKVVNVLAEATGITEPAMATVTLTAEAGAGVMVTIEPASITKERGTEMSEDGELEAESFNFKATAVCAEEGTWAMNWIATISATQNSDPSNDTQKGRLSAVDDSFALGYAESPMNSVIPAISPLWKKWVSHSYRNALFLCMTL